MQRLQRTPRKSASTINPREKEKTAALSPSVLLLLLIVVSPVLLEAHETWVPFEASTEPTPVHLELIQADHRGVTIDVTLPGMWVSSVTNNAGTFQRLTIPSCGRTADIGRPEMPYLGRFLGVPRSADVSITATPLDSLLLTDYTVWPAQEQPPDAADGTPREFEVDSTFYVRGPRYPSQLAKVSGKRVIRGCETVLLGIFPMHYEPVRKAVTIYPKVRVTVDFNGGSDQFIEPRLRSRFFEPLFSSLLLNYESFGEQPAADPVRDGEGEMIIVVPDALYWKIVPLAEWRTISGLPTVVIKLSDAGGSSWGIQNVIQQAYDDWQTPPSFVLLIGDSDIMPTNYYTYHPWQMNMNATDLYYCTVDGSDLFADIHHGRISVENSSQLEQIVDKLLMYEQEPLEGPWNNHVFLASYQEPGYYFHITSDRIYDYLISQGYDCDRAYENGTPPGNTTDVINNFNEGCFVVNHRDHGGRENWVHPEFWIYHFNQLTNGQMLPVVFSINCLSGYFDAETDESAGNFESFCEELLRLEDGGTIGIIGSTRTSYSGYNDEFNIGLYDAMWPNFDSAYPGGGTDNPWPTPVYRQGAVLNFGKWYMYDKFILTGGAGYPEWPPASWKTTLQFEMYHFHGDPALDIHTTSPTAMTVVHAPSVSIGAPSFTVQVDVDGALVALSTDGDLIGRAIVEDGQAVVTFDSPPSNPGIMDVVVTAHNRIPYQGEVEIGSQDGWFVVVDSTSAVDFWGHIDGVVEQGDSVALDIVLWNIGSEPAPNVRGELSSSDPAVDVAVATQDYGTIPPDAKVGSPNAFTLSVAGGVEDGWHVPLELEITSGDSLWVRDFYLEIHAPVLAYGGFQVDDSDGNSDGFPDPGETIDLWVSVANNGSGTAHMLSGLLSSPSSYVSIESGASPYPDIGPAECQTNGTAYSVSLGSGCPQGEVVQLDLDLEAFGIYQKTVSFQIVIGGTTVLVVDSDSEPTDTRLFDAMDVVGYPYQTWYVPGQGTVPLDTLRLYPVIVWTAGDNNTASMDEANRLNMAQYLSEGGALLFSAENYLSAYGEVDFTADYLHVASYAININMNHVEGLTGDPITAGMDIPLDYPEDMSDKPDAIVPDNDASGILTVGSFPQFCALRYPSEGTSPYRLIFLAVPFEALLPGLPDPSNPETLLENALDWLLASEDSEAPDPITDLAIAMGQSSNDLVLTWSMPYDNVGVTSYRIYRDVFAYSVPEPSLLRAVTSSTTWTDVGAAGDPESNFFYTVTALDGAENESAASNIVGGYDYDSEVNP